MNREIIKFIESLPDLYIGVVGDLMLDRYVFGHVNRISPEAPVPIHHVAQIDDRLGGAANVAANLRGLECKVSLYGLVGDDEDGRIVLKSLKDKNISADGTFISSGHTTTVKMRIIGSRQQMVRVDFEKNNPLDSEFVNLFCKALEADLQKGMKAVVISDYGKGMCTEELCQRVISLAHHYAVPVLIDPKATDWKRYRKADLVTPNIKELGQATSLEIKNKENDIVNASKRLLKDNDIVNIAATRSEKGITLVSNTGDVFHNPASAREVFDVSGAGDTVAAVLAASLAADISIPSALEVANKAAGVVVGKVGTYSIHRKELQVAFTKSENEIICNIEELGELLAQWRDNGDTIVFTNGCFDLLHRGHLVYLRAASELGKRLIVGVNSDDSVKRLKGNKRPIISQADRALLLSELRFIDAVVVFSEDTPANLIRFIHPDVLVKGGDYEIEDVVGKEDAGQVEIIPLVEGYSTTKLIQKIGKEI